VADSGIGMTKQEQTRIFKPFEQADISTTRKFGGTGLGLCIAKNLAHILGGDISVKSEPKKGSQFVIEIATYNQGHHITMLTRSQLTKTTTTEQLADTSQHLKGRILVAEDNVDNQELIKLLLSQWDIKVEFANNGVEAVEKALFSDFDLILMDMQMPVMGGLEATQLLRRAAYTGPIVALTANVMKNDTAAYLAAGCNKTLAKPINRQHFEQVLNQYLSLKMEHEWPQVLSAQTCYLEEISKNYKTKLPNLLAQITQLHNQQNHKELVDVAHSIKGSAGSFGFSEITQAAAELETSIRNNSDDKINDSVLELMKEIELGIES
jgi:CheY-like chemotaxis protein/HPt (histidine-containing phosphotransfer) domain-containing protein